MKVAAKQRLRRKKARNPSKAPRVLKLSPKANKPQTNLPKELPKHPPKPRPAPKKHPRTTPLRIQSTLPEMSKRPTPNPLTQQPHILKNQNMLLQQRMPPNPPRAIRSNRKRLSPERSKSSPY